MKFLLFPGLIFAQKNQQIDILNYEISIDVNDSTDRIYGSNTITLKSAPYLKESITLDFIQKDDTGKGMLVSKIMQNGKQVSFKQTSHHLIIQPINQAIETIHKLKIEYTGIPKDGLIIGKNKFDNRTFFGDNWPAGARHWFPCVDHPSDKATITFSITHPSHYTCVSNGKKKTKTALRNNKTTTTYSSKFQLPTKVMVFGLADFETDTLSHPSNMEHINFMFPEDKTKGTKDMSIASEPLHFFESHIAPYPFEKLYNVQSTTRYGGMENAGCIFYDEHAVTGQGSMEPLIAHEIAHQWFGNSATESDWSHLWLSEGFATYFTNLYLEHKYGREIMNEQLIKDRNRVIRFHKAKQLPLKDTVSKYPLQMLNPNAYQRGSWTLHMLRNKIGDDAFWKGIKAYYNAFKYKIASTAGLIRIMQSQTTLNLDHFFQQWTEQTGHPVLSSALGQRTGKQYLTLQQKQSQLFNFTLEIQLKGKHGETDNIIVFMTKQQQVVELPTNFNVESFQLDPNTNLLFEETN